MFKNVYFEISGICNAKCPWCITGIKNLKGASDGKFISIEEFERCIKYMLNNKIIGKNSTICLYNWGEPFLHPKLKDIIKILNSYDLRFGLSTNASYPIFFSEESILEKLSFICFSMPGFSQNSYDKIHGFNFQKIKENIKNIVCNFKNNGFVGEAYIAFHLYQFNRDEALLAKNFCEELNIKFNSSWAYFNGYSILKSYLDNSMDYHTLKKVSKELELFYIDELLNNKPINYKCPQWEVLTIDEECNVLTCCGVDRGLKDYSIGKISDLSYEDIIRLKKSKNICKECNNLGQSYLWHNPKIYDDTRELKETVSIECEKSKKIDIVFNNTKGKNIGIYGTGNHTEKLISSYLKYNGDFDFKVFFFNTNPNGEKFLNFSIYSPNMIEKLQIDKIIISSYDFQNEIYDYIKNELNVKSEIIKIYEENEECLFF